jgi:hypothetical protein
MSKEKRSHGLPIKWQMVDSIRKGKVLVDVRSVHVSGSLLELLKTTDSVCVFPGATQEGIFMGMQILYQNDPVDLSEPFVAITFKERG